MARQDDLRRVEQALTRVSRISTGREAARIRSERAGVFLSRPAIAILAALRASGPIRLTELSHRTGLEAALVSREVRELVDGGYVRRKPDPSDRRAGIVELTAKGRRTSERYRAATDEIIAETFASWSAADLRGLADQLERLSADFARGPRQNAQTAR